MATAPAPVASGSQLMLVVTAALATAPLPNATLEAPEAATLNPMAVLDSPAPGIDTLVAAAGLMRSVSMFPKKTSSPANAQCRYVHVHTY